MRKGWGRTITTTRSGGYADVVDIRPPTREEMMLIEEEVPTLRIYNNTPAAYYNAPPTRRAADVKKKLEHTALDDYI